MNLRDLQYLVAVAEYKHFGRAAEACFVSQPALSMQLQKLEDELGVVLFERTNKHVMITDIGADIVSRAQIMLRGAEEIKEAAKNAQNPCGGSLKIGAFPTLAPYFFPTIIPKITDCYPDLKLFLVEEKTGQLIEELKRGVLDAAFVAVPLPQEEGSLEYVELIQDPFLIAMPTTHPLAKCQSISREDLKKESLLLLEEGHCLRDQALEVCSTIGGAVNQSFRATSLETLRQMVIANIGITLIPKMAVNQADGICYIPFKDSPPSRIISMIWRKTSPRKESFRAIIKTLGYQEA